MSLQLPSETDADAGGNKTTIKVPSKTSPLWSLNVEQRDSIIRTMCLVPKEEKLLLLDVERFLTQQRRQQQQSNPTSTPSVPADVGVGLPSSSAAATDKVPPQSPREPLPLENPLIVFCVAVVWIRLVRGHVHADATHRAALLQFLATDLHSSILSFNEQQRKAEEDRQFLQGFGSNSVPPPNASLASMTSTCVATILATARTHWNLQIASILAMSITTEMRSSSRPTLQASPSSISNGREHDKRSSPPVSLVLFHEVKTSLGHAEDQVQTCIGTWQDYRFLLDSLELVFENFMGRPSKSSIVYSYQNRNHQWGTKNDREAEDDDDTDDEESFFFKDGFVRRRYLLRQAWEFVCVWVHIRQRLATDVVLVPEASRARTPDSISLTTASDSDTTKTTKQESRNIHGKSTEPTAKDHTLAYAATVMILQTLVASAKDNCDPLYWNLRAYSAGISDPATASLGGQNGGATSMESTMTADQPSNGATKNSEFLSVSPSNKRKIALLSPHSKRQRLHEEAAAILQRMAVPTSGDGLTNPDGASYVEHPFMVVGYDQMLDTVVGVINRQAAYTRWATDRSSESKKNISNIAPSEVTAEIHLILHFWRQLLAKDLGKRAPADVANDKKEGPGDATSETPAVASLEMEKAAGNEKSENCTLSVSKNSLAQVKASEDLLAEAKAAKDPLVKDPSVMNNNNSPLVSKSEQNPVLSFCKLMSTSPVSVLEGLSKAIPNLKRDRWDQSGSVTVWYVNDLNFMYKGSSLEFWDATPPIVPTPGTLASQIPELTEVVFARSTSDESKPRATSNGASNIRTVRNAVTPPLLTKSMEVNDWAVSVLAANDVRPSPQLLGWLVDEKWWRKVLIPLVNQSLLGLLQQHLVGKSMRVSPVTIELQPSFGIVRVHGDMTEDKELCRAVVAFFYQALEAIIIRERERAQPKNGDSLTSLIENEEFLRAVLACCCTCVTKAVGATLKSSSTPSAYGQLWVLALSISKSSPYMFLKTADSFLKALSDPDTLGRLQSPLMAPLPRLLEQYLRRAEREALDVILWSTQFPSFDEQIADLNERTNEGDISYWPPPVLSLSLPQELKYNSNQASETSLKFPSKGDEAYAEHRSMNHIFRKLLLLVVDRIRGLCIHLHIPRHFPVADEVYTAFRHLLRRHTAVFLDRHIDQWIMCTLYGVSKALKFTPEVTFARIIQAYISVREADLMESGCQKIVRQVTLSDGRIGTIIDLYNKVFVPYMKDYLLESASVQDHTLEIIRLKEVAEEPPAFRFKTVASVKAPSVTNGRVTLRLGNA